MARSTVQLCLLRAVGARLDGIEVQPALRLKPSEITQQVAAEVRRASEEAARGHAEAGAHLNAAVRDLRALIGPAHGQLAQQRREWIAIAGGGMHQLDQLATELR